MTDPVLMTVLLGVIALIYSTVGHAGASSYLALLALSGMLPEQARPTALVLNLVVAVITTTRFAVAGHLRWQLLWPFALTAVPMAFVGGLVPVPHWLWKAMVGGCLLVAAWRLWLPAPAERVAPEKAPIMPALAIGAGLGFLSGLIGVGGGIFLSPLLLLSGWASPRTTAAASAAFILLNSAAGLAGRLTALPVLPPALPWWALAVLIGGWVGSRIGAATVSPLVLRRLLAAVLALAGTKLALG